MAFRAAIIRTNSHRKGIKQSRYVGVNFSRIHLHYLLECQELNNYISELYFICIFHILYCTPNVKNSREIPSEYHRMHPSFEKAPQWSFVDAAAIFQRDE